MPKSNKITNIKLLHDRDFNLWTEEIKKAIANRDLDNMDWDNLLDEIDDMGKSDKRALRSYIQRLIEHIFKIKYWESERERALNGWKIEVINFRTQIANILEDSPSLKNYLADNYRKWYQQLYQKYQKGILFKMPSFEYVELEQLMQDDYFGEV